MRITQKTIYALQFLTYLKLYGQNRFMQVKEVSEHQHISEKYLEAIVARLKSDNLVSVKRGAHGGYMLTPKGLQASLKDVTDSVEVWSPMNQYSASQNGNTILNSIVKNLNMAEAEYNKLIEGVKLEKLAEDAAQSDSLFYAI